MKEEEIKNEAVEDEVITPETEEIVEEIAEQIAAEDGKDGKKKRKDKKLDELKDKIEELEDIRKRQMAEFENFRRRTDREKATMFDMGARSVVEKILPVVDNFERGLSAVPEGDSAKAFVDGMNMIYKQLTQELEKLGVKEIEAKGNQFDPNLHNAVMQVASEELESGVVAEVFQKGYTMNDVVIRHSMVSVVE